MPPDKVPTLPSKDEGYVVPAVAVAAVVVIVVAVAVNNNN